MESLSFSFFRIPKAFLVRFFNPSIMVADLHSSISKEPEMKAGGVGGEEKKPPVIRKIQ